MVKLNLEYYYIKGTECKIQGRVQIQAPTVPLTFLYSHVVITDECQVNMFPDRFMNNIELFSL